MRFVFLLIAILCAIVLIIKMQTGELEPGQVAGIMGFCLALAIVAPADWPNWKV